MSRNDDYMEIESDGKLVLPSQINQEKNQKKISKSSLKRKKQLKWIFIFVVLITIYIFYNNIIMYFLGVLKTYPTVYSYYLLIEAEIKNNTIKGLFYVSILGSLFFLVLPSEALFIYYLSSTSYEPIIIVMLVVLGTLVGFTFNYFFGWLLGERILKFMFKKNFENYKSKIIEYGGKVLVVGCIIPGPIEMLAVFYGGFKFGYWRFIYLVFIGRLIKYLLLLVAFIFFWDQIMYYYHGIIDSVIILKGLYL